METQLSKRSIIGQLLFLNFNVGPHKYYIHVGGVRTICTNISKFTRETKIISLPVLHHCICILFVSVQHIFKIFICS